MTREPTDTTDTTDQPGRERGPLDSGQEDSWPQVDRRRQTFWQWLRQTARLWGFLAFIFLILISFRQVILPFVLAVLVAYVLAPVLRRLCACKIGGRSCPRWVWLVGLYVVLLGLVALFTTTFVPRLTGDFKRLIKEAPAFWNKARTEYVPRVAEWVNLNLGSDILGAESQPASQPVRVAGTPRVQLRRTAGGELELDLSQLKLELSQQKNGRWLVQVPPPDRQRVETQSGRISESINHHLERMVTQSESRMRQVVGLGQKLLILLLNTITTFILVLMISAFLLLDTERILSWLRNLVPPSYFHDFDNVIVLIDKGLSGAIRGQLMICTINGVLTWVGLMLIGVKYSLLLALLAGVMSLIPIFGSILSSIPIVLVALASGESGLDVIKGLLILLWIIGIHLLEANLLNPKIMGTAAKIHPVVVIFAVVAGERTYGPMGALLGVPLVSAVQAVFLYIRRKVRDESETAGAGAEPAPTSSGESRS